ncbi:alpha beta hydrolase fold protein [Colletotrichum incanum]|nr:alpha beta hydrolase fold protein [Colletotrichum incanum]
MHDWSWQVPFLLGNNFRVISVDGRCQGKSSAPQPTPNINEVVDYHPQSTAEDVVALLESLGITKNVIIMAHSLGECTGYYIATTRPDLVKASIGAEAWHLRRMAQLDKAVPFAQCWGGWGDPEHSLGRRENAVKAFAGKLKCPRVTFGSNDWYVATDRDHLPKGDEKLDEIVIIEGKGH